MDAFTKGVDEFNRKDFFTCHDTWEQLWMDARGPSRRFLQGMIQIAVGYYHASNANYRGAENLFRKGLDKLSAYLPAYAGLQLHTLLPIFEHHLTLFIGERSRDAGPFDVTRAPILILDNPYSPPIS